jgi:hypothetical protein
VAGTERKERKERPAGRVYYQGRSFLPSLGFKTCDVYCIGMEGTVFSTEGGLFLPSLVYLRRSIGTEGTIYPISGSFLPAK